MGQDNVDSRIVAQIKGTPAMKGEQRSSSLINVTKSATAEDTRLRSLTTKQRKVYDNIVAGVSGDALESATGLTGTEVQQAIQELQDLRILTSYSAADEARVALDKLDAAQRARVSEGGEARFTEAQRQAASALGNTGDLGISEGKRLLGQSGLQSLYGGSQWSYRALLGARKLSGEGLGKMPDVGWQGVTEIKKAYEPYKASYKTNYGQSYSDWYNALSETEKGYVDREPSKYRKTDEELDQQAQDYWTKEVANKW